MQKQFDEQAAQMPLSKELLKALFEHLDRPNIPPCNHTLDEAIAFCKQNDLEVDRIIPWLNEYGGYCDCEVMHNVADKWADYADFNPDLNMPTQTTKPTPVKTWWQFWK